MRLQGQSKIMKDEWVGVVREGCVTYVDGKPVKSDVTTFRAQGSFQPLSGKDLMLVPEGDRLKEQWWLYTRAKLKVSDRVERCGVNYEAQTIQDWGDFQQVRVSRIDVGPHANRP